ncbi:MAG: SMC-Scp complex subunit ScpB [Acidobacteriales bacterium]|nr:SMC-Scp complex subunit ScpB [Terriglobales bacterium]
MQPSDIPAAPVSEEIPQELTPEQLDLKSEATTEQSDEERLLAILEAIVYVTDEPLSAAQIAAALGEPPARIEPLLERLVTEYNKPSHGVTIRELAGGYKMTTKAEHHEAIRAFVKNLKPPLKLSLAALETLSVIAYKQPITSPEVMEVRGVQGAGVLKTLLDRKLITSAGRKNVIGRPILYKTTKEFLVQFGLKNLNELPTLKEFEDLRRLALSDSDAPAEEEKPAEGTPEAAATAAESAAPAEPDTATEAEPAPEMEPEQQVEAAAEAAPASEAEPEKPAEAPAVEETPAPAEAPKTSSDE